MTAPCSDGFLKFFLEKEVGREETHHFSLHLAIPHIHAKLEPACLLLNWSVSAARGPPCSSRGSRRHQHLHLSKSWGEEGQRVALYSMVINPHIGFYVFTRDLGEAPRFPNQLTFISAVCLCPQGLSSTHLFHEEH